MSDETDNTPVTTPAGQTTRVRRGTASGGCLLDATVRFETARSFIRPDQRPALEQGFAFGLTSPASGTGAPVAAPNRFLLIVGHTDQVGGAAGNQELSERRARATLAVFTSSPDVWEQIYHDEGWGVAELETMSLTVDSGGSSALIQRYRSDRTARLDLFQRYLVALRPSWLPQPPPAVRPAPVTVPSGATLGCGMTHPRRNAPNTAVEENRRVELFFFTSATAGFTNCARYPRRQATCGRFFTARIELRDGCGNPYAGSFDVTLPTIGRLTNQQTDSTGVWTRENSPGGRYTVQVGGWTSSGDLSASNPVLRAEVLLAIRAVGTSLCRGGTIFRFFGTNAYYLMESSALGPSQQEVSDFFRVMQACGIKVVRTWAFNDDQGKPLATRTQVGGPRSSPSPGRGLDSLEVVIDLAAQQGIYLILALTNYWKDYGGIAQYARWVGYDVKGDPTAVPPVPARTPDGNPNQVVQELFYIGSSSDPAAAGLPDPRTIYRNYVCMVINRFRNKPNILAWELMNEPRAADMAILINWIVQTGRFIRQQCNPPQLLSVGGVEITSMRRVYSDPSVRSVIDLVDTHLYPDDLHLDDAAAMSALIDAKVVADLPPSKPFYLGEFGRDSPNKQPPPPTRLRTRAQEYERWSNELLARGAAGMLFWQLLPPRRRPFDTRELNVDLSPATSGLLQSVPALSPNPQAPTPTDGAQVVDFVNRAIDAQHWHICGNPNCGGS